MKKLLLLIFLLSISFSVFTQEAEIESKNTKRVKKEKMERFFLAEKGDFALGADLVPLLRTLGTVFWGERNTIGFQGTPYFNGFPYPNVSIMSKYMLTKNCAIRANIGALIVSYSQIDSIRNDKLFMNDSESEAKVADKTTMNTYGVSISLGAEYRLGKRRVVGIFGGDLLIGYYEGTVKTKYGNEMSEENPIPTTYDYNYFFTSISDNSRALVHKNGGAISAGLQLTTGIEVFVAPKIALGGQVNLSYIFTYNKQDIITAEGFNEETGSVKKVNVTYSPKGWSHNFSTNNVGASLYMMFYF
jgi:hypothetical protein